MKKRIISVMLAAMILCAGCGAAINIEEDEITSEDKVEEFEDAKSESSNEVATISSEESSVDTSEEIDITDEEDDTTKDTDTSKDEDDSTNDVSIYESFVSNTEEVFFDESVSDILPYSLQRNFDLSKGYTIDEIIEASLDSYTSYDDSKDDPSFETKYIDCGNDGIDELLVDIRFPGMETADYTDYEEKYVDRWVIKEIDGKLIVKYVGALRHESYTIINDYGYIKNEVMGAYNGVLSESYGYLDADANWVLYYKYNYYLDMDDYVREKGNYGYDLDCSSDGWSNMQVEEYIFDDEAKITDSKDSGFITYYKYDSDGIIEDDSIYEDSSIYKKTFDDADVNICPYSEVEKRLEERREEIGLSEDVMG